MKVEEKMKKNKNCELSHMVRPAGSLEVYKEKQNILFIYESVEHRRSKVTWARLWVCSGVCTAECMAECSGVCTVRWFVKLGSDICTVRWFVKLGSDIHFARLVRARGSVGRDASTVWSRRTDCLHTG